MVTVVKATGEKEFFSEDKVRLSIQRAGIPKELEEDILNHIKEKLHENIPTSEIFYHITEFLGKSPYPHMRARYSLKQSIMLLGPTGYPFEDYLARIFQAEGYTTSVREVLQGKCISHETDVIAVKDGKKIYVEAKYHNNPGIHTDIHVSLYTKARYDDIREKNNLTEGWLVTNTKATVDAITYGHCADLKIIAWSYPQGESLRDLIEKHKLHPLTALSSISDSQKQSLLENHVVLCRDVLDKKEALSILPKDLQQKITEEAKLVCAF